MSLHLSKCHIVGNHLSQLILYVVGTQKDHLILSSLIIFLNKWIRKFSKFYAKKIAFLDLCSSTSVSTLHLVIAKI